MTQQHLLDPEGKEYRVNSSTEAPALPKASVEHSCMLHHPTSDLGRCSILGRMNASH
jgi:hypothetical protein